MASVCVMEFAFVQRQNFNFLNKSHEIVQRIRAPGSIGWKVLCELGIPLKIVFLGLTNNVEPSRIIIRPHTRISYELALGHGKTHVGLSPYAQYTASDFNVPSLWHKDCMCFTVSYTFVEDMCNSYLVWSGH